MSNFSVRQSDDGVFHLSGELDLAEVVTFFAQTEAALNRRDPVVLDLEGVTFVDSSGLHAIVILAEQCRGGGLVLRAPRPQVARVIDMLRLEELPGIRVER